MGWELENISTEDSVEMGGYSKKSVAAGMDIVSL